MKKIMGPLSNDVSANCEVEKSGKDVLNLFLTVGYYWLDITAENE